MIILAIDTSFDDTAVAVTSGNIILSNVLSTDLEPHLGFGGVVPDIAREAHKRNLDPEIELALKKAKLSWSQIDAIAVTQGPGLAICLEVGIAKAKELALKHKKTLIPVNHLEGHLLSFLAKRKQKVTSNNEQVNNVFPLLGILLSGGNTQFVYAPEVGKYQIIGQTKDDAMGEAFDKIGRMLGLGYPAGALIEKMALVGKPEAVVFPVPMRQVKSADTSFSGLKTAAMRIVEAKKQENGGILSKQDVADIALGFQTAAIKHLSEKLEFGFGLLAGKEIKSLAAGGGVMCNLAVRKVLRAAARKHGLPVYFPDSKKLCTDNAAMIGIAAAYHQPASGDFDRKPVYTLSSVSHGS